MGRIREEEARRLYVDDEEYKAINLFNEVYWDFFEREAFLFFFCDLLVYFE